MFEKLKLLEEGLKGLFLDGIASSADEFRKNVTLPELVMFSCFGTYEALQEVLGINFIDPEKTPLVFSCITPPIDKPAVKEACHPHEKMVAFLIAFRENALKSTTA
ncbi:putative glutathione transferase [Rosa chinensis]|uniref:Putative glutathione transferase n=1 Tax=Rosa chinensis TaxID=74649 RepID=A0A2P6P2J6_ROSCH|nr:putative glutathione transferase [Rosa chinensis]